MKRYSISFKWSYRQVVKSSPFHGGVTGSNPVGTTNKTIFKDIHYNLTRYVEKFILDMGDLIRT